MQINIIQCIEIVLQTQTYNHTVIATTMKLVQSFLGFKAKKSMILQQRNSILKLLLIINIPNIILIVLFNQLVPQVYMDEYFHYNQFLNYYHNQYHIWDRKITTPPGLYHLQKLISVVSGSSLGAMRAVNALVFGNLFLVFAMKIYQFNDHNVNNLSRSLNLALTPTIFFFNFLDYTDSASLALITMAYYYCLTGSEWRTSICSLLSVYVRQNNIIWITYLLMYRVITTYSASIMSIRGNVVGATLQFIKIMLINSKHIIIKNLLQIIIVPIFFWYLYRYNDGRLVFGDHQNHQASFHPTQILYLSLFIAINLPISLNDFIVTIRDSFSRMYFSRHAFAAYLFLVSICIVLVDKWSIAHPFILADNRHYVFYLYRYFKWAKYPLCLLYPFCMIILVKLIVNSNQKLVKFIIWGFFSLFYLMLSPLVQLRYFTIPFVLISFEIKNRNLSFDVQKIHRKQVNQEKALNRMIFTTLAKIFINFIVFYTFLFRPFGEGGKQRFIW